jgi:xanthine dehydrogenase molybdopterin-binding subunit B
MGSRWGLSSVSRLGRPCGLPQGRAVQFTSHLQPCQLICTSRTPIITDIEFAAAESREQAEAAVAAVVVRYANVLPPVVNITDAVKAGGKFVKPGTDYSGKPSTVQRGDVSKAFASAAYSASGSIDIAGQYHFHMETQTCTAMPTQGDGVVLHCACQAPSMIQQSVATATTIPLNKITVETVRVGGAFGGKVCAPSLACQYVPVGTCRCTVPGC